MLVTTFPLVLFAFGGSVFAQMLARFVPQDISARSLRSAGGLALIPEKFCSNDLLSCFSGAFCCPTSFACQLSVENLGGTCCPPDANGNPTDCRTGLEAAPYCVDSTWTLWDESQGGINKVGYFYYAASLVGLLTRECVDPSTVSAPTLEAMLMAPGGAPLTTTTDIVAAASGTVIGTTITTTSVSASTATVVSFSNTTVTKSSSRTKPATSLSTVTPESNPTIGVTPSSSSAQPSTSTKSSDATIFKTFDFGTAWLLQGALALLVGVAL
ncbi:hypothetical protein NA56DRAFT_703342 [Hyaloscypha hepaticicola]|uniref:Uncharacterized protein n=1 Tax=Hyaloscypha hepaticicola TaxID=2082293 RepID=A0A2J6Q609_9HELO|nr:hypothetical protein NA56DRAFT_703342 [Hyaloscypha hepaticicola]